MRNKKKSEKKVEIVEKKSFENIKIAFLFNLTFSLLEGLGGILTNSISILSNAIHDFCDSFSIGISFLLEKKNKINSDKINTYNYLKYSLLGAIVTSVVLIFGSGIIIFNSIPRLINPDEVNHDAMIIFAIFGIIINGYAAYKTSKSIKYKEKSINLHMLEDVFGWILILVGSIIIKIFGLIIIDPIMSILLGLFILLHVYRNLKDIFDIIMEKVPKDIDIEKIKKDLKMQYNFIEDINHVHVWSVDGVNNCISAHILINKCITINQINEFKNSVKLFLKDKNIIYSTIEIEYDNDKFDKKLKEL